jgi:hypothetical protein
VGPGGGGLLWILIAFETTRNTAKHFDDLWRCKIICEVDEERHANDLCRPSIYTSRASAILRDSLTTYERAYELTRLLVQ